MFLTFVYERVFVGVSVAMNEEMGRSDQYLSLQINLFFRYFYHVYKFLSICDKEIHKNTYARAYTHGRARIHTHTHTRTCIHSHMHTRVRACLRARIFYLFMDGLNFVTLKRQINAEG